MTGFNKYVLSAEMEAEAAKAAEAYMKAAEEAAEDAWLKNHPEPEESVEDALEGLMDEVLTQMKFMRKRMKDAGASDEILSILDRYVEKMPSIIEE